MSDQTIEQRLDDIKEATKRFCRTDEAADNLAKYILQLLNEAEKQGFKGGVDSHNVIVADLVNEARKDELHLSEQGTDTEVSGLTRAEYYSRRYKELTPKENK